MLLLSLKFNLKHIWLLFAFLPFQAAIGASEYELKAAFIHSLTNFITWPSKSFSSEELPFLICVLGTDYFGDALDTITNGQKVAGHTIQIAKLTNEAEAKNCHLIFISNSEQSKMSKILNNLKNNPALTVGDTDDFIDQGGMVMFINTPEGKIKLGIQPDRLTEAQLKASSKLLQIAKIIK